MILKLFSKSSASESLQVVHPNKGDETIKMNIVTSGGEYVEVLLDKKDAQKLANIMNTSFDL